MKKIIYFGIIFFLMFATSVNACMNPVIKTDGGANVNPIVYCPSCEADIWGALYSGSSVNYNFTIENRNREGIFVSMGPDIGLRDYVSSGSVFVPGNSQRNLTLTVWIDDFSRSGVLEVDGYCDNPGWNSWGNDASINLNIKGKNVLPPVPIACFRPERYNHCSDGLFQKYICSNDTRVLNDTVCTQTCCKGFGGKLAYCSSDREVCLTPANVTPGTEGNIAFLCKDKKCADKQENQLIFILQMKDWNVTPKYYKEWNESELDKYDLIVCSDQSKACKINFNSPVYNQHAQKGKPFLEIPFKGSAQAAYSFDYINKSNGYSLTDGVNVIKNHYMTSGYSGPVNTISGDARYVAIPTKYFSSAIEDLANSGISDKSIIFTANAAVDHGKYAFLGFLVKTDKESLTYDGELLLNRTLKWLKTNDFSLQSEGKIAFLCGRDDCKGKTEKNLIMWLRENNFYVSAKSLTSWSLDELNQFDLMVCSDEVKGCRVDMNTAISQMHMNHQKGFLEISASSFINAGFRLGYTSSSKGSTKTSTDIYSVSDHPILTGFGNPINVLSKKKSIYSIITSNLNSVSVLALDSPTPGLKNYSPMFVSDSSGNRGRYSYVGWYANPDYATETAQQLILRTVRWVKCGNPNGC